MLPVLVLLGTIAGAWYLLIVRPQRDQVTRHQQVVGSLREGSHVMTVGGLFGRVAAVEGDSVVLELAPGTLTRVAADGIARLVQAEQARAVPAAQASGMTAERQEAPPMAAPQHHQHPPAAQQAPQAPPQDRGVPAWQAPPVHGVQAGQAVSAPAPAAPHVVQPFAAQRPGHVTLRARVEDVSNGAFAPPTRSALPPRPTFAQPARWGALAGPPAAAQPPRPQERAASTFAHPAPSPQVAAYHPGTHAQSPAGPSLDGARVDMGPTMGAAGHAAPPRGVPPAPAPVYDAPPAHAQPHYSVPHQQRAAPSPRPDLRAAMAQHQTTAQAPPPPALIPATAARQSRAPQGMGSSLRLDDPSIADSMQRATQERMALAHEVHRSGAPLVDLASTIPLEHGADPLAPPVHRDAGTSLFVSPGAPGVQPIATWPAAPTLPQDLGVPRPVVHATGPIDPALANAFQRRAPYVPHDGSPSAAPAAAG